MTANLIITNHAAERIAQRFEPLLAERAAEIIEDFVLDAVWNCRLRRRAPRWMPARVLRRGEDVRYVVGWVERVRFVCVVAVERGHDPVLVTVITEDARRHAPLPAVPELADGRVIGRPRTTPLPVAFQPAVAA